MEALQNLSRDRDNEPLVSIKGGELLDEMSEYQLLKKDSVPCS
jgi:hypothetical protein